MKLKTNYKHPANITNTVYYSINIITLILFIKTIYLKSIIITINNSINIANSFKINNKIYTKTEFKL